MPVSLNSKHLKLMTDFYSNGKWEIQWSPRCPCTFISSVILISSEIMKGLSTTGMVALGPPVYDNKSTNLFLLIPIIHPT